MNNDLKEQDMTYSGDPMFDEILKDLLSLSTATSEDTNVSNDEENHINTDSSETSDNLDNSIVKS